MLIIAILFTVALVIGVQIITHEGMGLHSLREWGEKKEWAILEIGWLCEWCMPTLWSLAGYGFAYLYAYWFEVWDIEHFYRYFAFYPIVVAASSFISGVLWTLTEILIEKLNFNK